MNNFKKIVIVICLGLFVALVFRLCHETSLNLKNYSNLSNEVTKLKNNLAETNKNLGKLIENEDIIVIDWCEPCTQNYEQLLRADNELEKNIHEFKQQHKKDI